MNGEFDPGKILEAAKKFREKINRMNEELGRCRIEADSGAGMVRVVANGRGEVLEVKIDPMAAQGDDVPMLEDLVRAAVNEALKLARAAAEEEQRKLVGGMPIPIDLTKLGGAV